jgi:hypothetical protein
MFSCESGSGNCHFGFGFCSLAKGGRADRYLRIVEKNRIGPSVSDEAELVFLDNMLQGLPGAMGPGNKQGKPNERVTMIRATRN